MGAVYILGGPFEMYRHGRKLVGFVDSFGEGTAVSAHARSAPLGICFAQRSNKTGATLRV